MPTRPALSLFAAAIVLTTTLAGCRDVSISTRFERLRCDRGRHSRW
jgi:hypothetical protein